MSFPDGPFKTMPVLGCSFLEESCPSLTIQPTPGAKQGEVKGAEAAPLPEDKLCLLSGLWSQGLSLSLSHGGLQLLESVGEVPNTIARCPGH